MSNYCSLKNDLLVKFTKARGPVNPLGARSPRTSILHVFDCEYHTRLLALGSAICVQSSGHHTIAVATEDSRTVQLATPKNCWTVMPATERRTACTTARFRIGGREYPKDIGHPSQEEKKEQRVENCMLKLVQHRGPMGESMLSLLWGHKLHNFSRNSVKLSRCRTHTTAFCLIM